MALTDREVVALDRIGEALEDLVDALRALLRNTAAQENQAANLDRIATTLEALNRRDYSRRQP